MKSKMKKFLKSILPVLMVVALSLSSSVALLAASTQKITNTFKGMYTGVELREPSWDPSADNTYFANETIAKDPQVYNSGNEEAYVYLSVFIPYVSSGYYADSYIGGSRKYVYREARNTPDHEAFSYTVDYTYWENLMSPNYNRQTTITYKGKDVPGTMTFYAYYKPIASGETTMPLFETMTFIDYDVDEENRLEDEEKAGNGAGSDIIGKELPVIIQPYAITADVTENMKEFSDSKMSEGEYWNYGPMMAWTYLVEQMEQEYIDEAIKPKFLSLKELYAGDLDVDIYSASQELLTTVRIKTICSERMNFEFFNSVLAHLETLEENEGIEFPRFDDEKEMYDAFEYGYVVPNYGIYVYPDDPIVANEGCFLKEVRAIVNVNFFSSGELQTTGVLYFNEGDSITNEILRQRILDEYGYNVDFADQEINETAVKSAEYYINVNIVA